MSDEERIRLWKKMVEADLAKVVRLAESEGDGDHEFVERIRRCRDAVASELRQAGGGRRPGGQGRPALRAIP